MDYKKFLMLFFLFAAFSPLFAQEEDFIPYYRLSDVVVSATKTENPAIFLASSVSVIDSAEIERREKILLLDILKSEYGLSYTSQGNPGALSFVSIRGANTGHTLVLIDGIEMNMPTDPGNTFDFSTVTTNNIERIEILRGPQSTLYGSDALAGVINVFTKKGSRGLSLNLLSEAGSYNTFRGNAGVSGGGDIFNFNINYGRVSSDGYSSASKRFGNTENDGFSNSTISAGGGIYFSPSFEMNLRYHFTAAEADLDRSGGPSGDDPTYLSEVEESGFRGSAKLSLFDNKWEQTAGFSFNRNFRKYRFDETPLHPSSSRSRYDGNKIKVDWMHNLALPYNVLTAGIEFEEEKTVSDYAETGAFPYSSFLPESRNNTFGIYLQDQFNYGHALFITPGLRYDDNKIFGSKITYSIAPAYFIWSTGTKIRGTYGTGFKSPSLFYLFDPVYGNENLRPEESKGWDAGIEQYLINSNLTAGLTYFKMDFVDMFGFDPQTYKTVNIYKASTEGVEFFFSVRPIGSISLKSNYTFTQVKDKSDGSGSSVLLRRPKHKASLLIDYNFTDDAYAGLEVLYTGKRSDIYYPPDFMLPPENIIMNDYFLINLSLSYKISDQVKLFARLENLLNKQYEEIYGFGTPGFSVYGGVKIETGDFFR